MCVVSHGHGGLGGGRDGGGGWYACGTKTRERRKTRGLIERRQMPEHFRVRGDTLMTPDHTAVQVRSSV